MKKGEFLARDVYPMWKRRVSGAQRSIRVFSPYLGRQIVDLLGNSSLGPQAMSVVTDLSPDSGAINFVPQLRALRRLIRQGIEVRTLDRLHAKVLQVDEGLVTVGSQNFTSYARGSLETTYVPSEELVDAEFNTELDSWYQASKRVNLDLIDLLLAELADEVEAADEAQRSLQAAYELLSAPYFSEVERRLETALGGEGSRIATGLAIKELASREVSAGQRTAYARLDWVAPAYEYQSLLRLDQNMDFTRWTSRHRSEVFAFAPRAFYPALLGPGERLRFARVAQSRITYVWSSFTRGGSVEVSGMKLAMSTKCLDPGPDGANLEVRLKQDQNDSCGCEVRLRFDGGSVIRIGNFQTFGRGRTATKITHAIQDLEEDRQGWDEIVRTVLSPASRPRGFKSNPNADEFFPRGWLQINASEFMGNPVLLIQPYKA